MKFIISFCFFLLSYLIIVSCGKEIELTPLESHQFSLEEYGKEWLDSLCCKSFQGRKAGTYGNQLAYEFLVRQLNNMGYIPECQSFKTEEGTDIHNIIVTFPGQTDSTIIIGAHYDGAIQSGSDIHYPAANDNASGTVTLLMLLKELADNKFDNNKTMVVCFWGCEEYFEGRTFRASLYYTHSMSDYYKQRVLLYINLDTMGHQNDEHKMLLEYSFHNRVISTVDSIKTSGHFEYVTRARMSNMYSDFYSFYEVGIPFINFHDYCVPVCAHPIHSIYDTQDFISIMQLSDVIQDILGMINSY